MTDTVYSNIKRVKEVSSNYSSKGDETVNQYLEHGWILLNSYVTDYSDPRTINQIFYYVLGLPKEIEFDDSVITAGRMIYSE